jgi:hypothetical protein
VIEVIARIRKQIFGINPEEITFSRRGFREGNPAVKKRLEEVGGAFLLGYHAALLRGRAQGLEEQLEPLRPDFRGFAYEGAAMGLALLDWLTPWNRSRIPDFLKGAGDPHTYMVHVGAGWIMARVPGRIESFMDRFDPLLRWLLVDGYGFHEAFFHGKKYLNGGAVPRRVRGYAQRVFHQGFGRCLWFMEGGSVARIAESISRFSQEWFCDLWSGVGLASVYAGEISEAELMLLREKAGEFQPQLAQGAAFAAKARERVGNLTAYHDLACSILCGMNAHAAAAITDEQLENLPITGSVPAYEIWRKRIQQKFNQHMEVKK